MSPTRMTEATLELDSIHNKLMFKPAHVLVYIKPHPRCRVCAFGYNPLLHNPNGYGASFCGGMFCARYQLLDPRFLDFVAFCCYLQDIFYKHCANQRKSPLWEQLPGYCREQQWWWNRVNMFQLQCERSLVFLAPHLEQMMAGVLGAAQGVLIVEIRELKIATPKYYEYIHCSFLIRTVHNECWVFDPTGVQFGPHWPLISKLSDYIMWTSSNDPARRKFARSRPLGTSRRLANANLEPF